MSITQGKIWLAFVLMGTMIVSCQNNNTSIESDSKNGAALDSPFFSLQKYFESEAQRLSNLSASVTKEVSINQKTETKTLKSLNWLDEFSAFIASDINKTAWVEHYETDSSFLETHYSTPEKDLRTKSITIKKDSLQKVKAILISNFTQNNLYTTEENLQYFPDSLYIIETNQSVRALGDNFYKIIARFN